MSKRIDDKPNTDTACPYCGAERGRIYFSGEMEFTTWLKMKELIPGLDTSMGYCVECDAWIGIPVGFFKEQRRKSK